MSEAPEAAEGAYEPNFFGRFGNPGVETETEWVHDEIPLKMTKPEGWKVKQSASGWVLSGGALVEHVVHVHVTISPAAEGWDPQQTGLAYIERLQQEMEVTRVDNALTEVSGIPAARLRYDYTFTWAEEFQRITPSRIGYQAIALVMKQGRHMVAVTVRGTEAGMDASSEDVEAIMASVKIEP